MSLVLSKPRNRNRLPELVGNFLGTDNFFSPSVFDFNSKFFDLGDFPVVPEANIIETSKEFKIELAAPGLSREDFKVEVENNVLNVSAQKEEEEKNEKNNYRKREFSYTSFWRSFVLPENVLAEKIDAKYDQGVLLITLPKKEDSSPKQTRQIKVY